MTHHDMTPFAGEALPVAAPRTATVSSFAARYAAARADDARAHRASALDRLAHCRDMLRARSGRDGSVAPFADILSAVLADFDMADAAEAEAAAFAGEAA